MDATEAAFQPRSPSTSPPRQQLLESPGTCHGYAKRLALAGAMNDRDDVEPEKPKAEVLRTEEDASEQDNNPEEEEQVQGPKYDPREDEGFDEEVEDKDSKVESKDATPGEEETNLILNILDHDRLDYEPVNEHILDETKEVKILTSLFPSIRNRFRSRPARTGPIRTRIEETWKLGKWQKKNVHGCNLLYKNDLYLFHQLTYFILYYLYLWQSSLDANQFVILYAYSNKYLNSTQNYTIFVSTLKKIFFAP